VAKTLNGHKCRKKVEVEYVEQHEVRHELQ